jgi:hypothetical protein
LPQFLQNIRQALYRRFVDPAKVFCLRYKSDILAFPKGAKALFCFNCGSDLTQDAIYCSQCGIDQRVDQTTSGSAAQSGRRAEVKFVTPSEEMVEGVFTDGRQLIVGRHNGGLPNRCIKCGQAASLPFVSKTYRWHSPGLYILLISPLIYVIVALCISKQVELQLPFCNLHRAERKNRLFWATVLFISFLPVSIGIGTYVNTQEGMVLAWLIGLAMFVGACVFGITSNPLRVTYIGPGVARFKGAHPIFLEFIATANAQKQKIAAAATS